MTALIIIISIALLMLILTIGILIGRATALWSMDSDIEEYGYHDVGERRYYSAERISH